MARHRARLPRRVRWRPPRVGGSRFRIRVTCVLSVSGAVLATLCARDLNMCKKCKKTEVKCG